MVPPSTPLHTPLHLGLVTPLPSPPGCQQSDDHQPTGTSSTLIMPAPRGKGPARTTRDRLLLVAARDRQRPQQQGWGREREGSEGKGRAVPDYYCPVAGAARARRVRSFQMFWFASCCLNMRYELLHPVGPASHRIYHHHFNLLIIIIITLSEHYYYILLQ